MFITMDIVPNAPDGLVLAICDKTGANFGKIKVLFDCTSVIAAAALSLLFIGNISTIREGTIISRHSAHRLKKAVFDNSVELTEDIASLLVSKRMVCSKLY